MTQRIMTVMGLALLATVTTVEDASAQDMPMVGVGVRIEEPFSSLVGGLDSAQSSLNFYVPVNISPNLRLEPDLGFGRSAQDSETFNDDGEVVARSESESTLLRLGVGAFYMWSPAARTNIYGGARLGYIRTRLEEYQEIDIGIADVTSTSITTRNNLAVSLAFGGEAYLTTHFSLGGELALDFVNVGEPIVEDDEGNMVDGDDDTRSSDTRLSPSGGFFIRWYFL